MICQETHFHVALRLGVQKNKDGGHNSMTKALRFYGNNDKGSGLRMPPSWHFRPPTVDTLGQTYPTFPTLEIGGRGWFCTRSSICASGRHTHCSCKWGWAHAHTLICHFHCPVLNGSWLNSGPWPGLGDSCLGPHFVYEYFDFQSVNIWLVKQGKEIRKFIIW